jgi:hypothetical protein
LVSGYQRERSSATRRGSPFSVEAVGRLVMLRSAPRPRARSG